MRSIVLKELRSAMQAATSIVLASAVVLVACAAPALPPTDSVEGRFRVNRTDHGQPFSYCETRLEDDGWSMTTVTAPSAFRPRRTFELAISSDGTADGMTWVEGAEADALPCGGRMDLGTGRWDGELVCGTWSALIEITACYLSG